MDVTDILRDRMEEPGGLQRMAIVSALLHGALVVLLVVAPAGWFTARNEPTPRTVMTITLGGGAPGPANTGMTPLAARPVQAPPPAEPPRRPEPVRPPAARTPEMTIPREEVVAPPRPATPPPPRVEAAPPEARGTTPTRGDEPNPGQGLADTGTRGQGFGLASGGGGGTGVALDVADFCCPEYIATMVQRIQNNLIARTEYPGEVVVKFTIQRDGLMTNQVIEKPSNYQALNLNALRAITATRQLRPLPEAFPNPTLTVYLTFQFTR